MPDGSLLVVSMRDRRILRRAPDGAVTVHADVAELLRRPPQRHGRSSRRGHAYAGNFGFDLMGGGDPAPAALIHVDPDGTASVAAEEMLFPNGSVITPDGSTLIVGETAGARYTAFTIQDDGSLTDRRVWAQVATAPPITTLAETLGKLRFGPDGCGLDAEGHIWAADEVNARCARVAPGGEIVDEIPAPEGTDVLRLHARRRRRAHAAHVRRAGLPRAQPHRRERRAARHDHGRRPARRPALMADAGRLPARVASGLEAISRVARALTTPGALHEVAERALDAMRATLDLQVCVLYLPDAGGAAAADALRGVAARGRAQRPRGDRVRAGGVAAGDRRRPPARLQRAGRLGRPEPVRPAGLALARRAARDRRPARRRGDGGARRAARARRARRHGAEPARRPARGRDRQRAAAARAAGRGDRARAAARGRRGARRARAGPRAGGARARVPGHRAARARGAGQPRPAAGGGHVGAQGRARPARRPVDARCRSAASARPSRRSATRFSQRGLAGAPDRRGRAGGRAAGRNGGARARAQRGARQRGQARRRGDRRRPAERRAGRDRPRRRRRRQRVRPGRRRRRRQGPPRARR